MSYFPPPSAAAGQAQANAEAYTDAQLAAVVNLAPPALDTLKELADAIGDDPTFAQHVTPRPLAGVDGKVVKWDNLAQRLVDATDLLNSTYFRAFVVDAPTGVAATDRAAIEAKIAAAKASVAVNGGHALVVLLAGEYIADGIVMPTRITLAGAGRNVTTIRAENGSANAAVLLLDVDNVNDLVISDLQVLPAAVPNAGQHGIWFKTVTGVSGTGVLDQGGLIRVSAGDAVEQFSGNAIWLDGGRDGFLNPIQWMVLDQVETYASTTGKGLVMSGQVGQCQVRNGFSVGAGGIDSAWTQYGGGGASVWVGRALNDDGTYHSDTAPYGITFTNHSFQSNAHGLDVIGGMSVTVIGPHFEDTGHAITAYFGATVTVIGGESENGGHTTAGTGCLFTTDAEGIIIVEGHTVTGTVDKHYSGRVIPKDNNLGFGHQPISEFGTTQVSIGAGGDIQLDGYKTALVNASATHLITVRSNIGVGESMFLRAFGGTITLDWGGVAPGNLVASGLAFPYVVPQDAIVHLVRTDLAGGLNVVSVTH